MLRILDNADINMVFESLFLILMQSYQDLRQNEPYTEKIISLNLHCIDRLRKQFQKRLNEVNIVHLF